MPGSAAGAADPDPEASRWESAFRAAVIAQRGVIHPNRLQVIDLVEVDGRPAAVVEHVAGPSLATWLRVRQRPVDEIVPVFEDVVRGVGAAHEVGVHHLALDAAGV
ncbi:MAG: hypothetical protein R3F59_22815 [Myxococcota bacterium]